MANMYANIAQLSTDDEMKDAFAMITKNAAKLLSFETEIKVGVPATLVVIEAKDAIEAIEAIRTNSQALAGFKNGKQTFCNEAAYICFEQRYFTTTECKKRSPILTALFCGITFLQ